jgi:protein-tyrosine phosphatase
MTLFKHQISNNSHHTHVIPSVLDIHSHLIPGIDDGAQSMEESVNLVIELKRLGYKKAITTPHIMTDVFNNTREIILSGLQDLKDELKKRNIDFELEAAAEYYVDEFFIEKIGKEKLLTFGKNYILIETGFLSSTRSLKEAIFELKVNGYEPVFAHPERYSYLWGVNAKENYRVYKDMELLFQINLISLGGFYSPQAKKMTELLINENMVEFIGTDIHEQRYINAIELTLKSKYIEKLFKSNLLNDSLL